MIFGICKYSCLIFSMPPHSDFYLLFLMLFPSPLPIFLQEISNYLIHQIYPNIGIKWHSLIMLSSLIYLILISFLISNFVHLCVHFLNQFILAYQYSKKKWSLIKFTNCTEITIASFLRKSFDFFLYFFVFFHNLCRMFLKYSYLIFTLFFHLNISFWSSLFV